METPCFDLSSSTYLHVKPFGLEPASVAFATNRLKVYFPLKDKPQWGVGEVARNGSNYQLLHKLILGLCTDCMCERENECFEVKCNCMPVNEKEFLQTVHMFGMLIYISFLFGLEVFTRGGSCSWKGFWDVLKELSDEIKATSHKQL